MNIVYLLRYYPTLTETFVYDEIRRLLDLDLTIHIVSLGSREDGKHADQLPNVPTIQVPRARSKRLHWSSSPGINFLKRHQRTKDIARYRWLRDKLKELRPDVLHVHFAGEAAEWGYALQLDLGVPCCITTHAVDIFRPRTSLPVLLQNTHVRCISKFGCQFIQSEYSSNNKIEYIPCAVDIPSNVPDLPDDQLRAIFIGRDVPKKGLSTLLDAWSGQLTTQQLTLVTETRLTLPAGVQCLGFRPPSQIPQLIDQHNLLILPCQQAEDGDMDGIPIVFMEALSRGRPVLSTAISGIPELITEEVGWLLSDPTPDTLRNMLDNICADLGMLPTKGRKGPTHIIDRGFSGSCQQEALQRWFQNVTV